MSWAGIAANQCVSLNNLQDAVDTSVFTLKNTIPAGLKQITKAEANDYVDIDVSYAPYAAKSSNQLVVKSDLVAATPVTPCSEFYVVPSEDELLAGDGFIYFSFTDCCGVPTTTSLNSPATFCVQSPFAGLFLYYLVDDVPVECITSTYSNTDVPCYCGLV